MARWNEMNDMLFLFGWALLFTTIIGTYWYILSYSHDSKKQIIAKQDAIMAKLIEIKHR